MGLRQIPYLIHQSYLGNWQPFVSLFPSTSSFDDFLAEGLYLCITCTEDVPFITSEEADSLTRGTFVGKYRIEQQMAACANWTKGTVPNDFFEPLRSDIPTLVISGSFDPVTAPSMVERIIETLPNSFLISIPEMSHVSDGLSSPECVDKVTLDFFKNPMVKPNIDCIGQMLPGEFIVN
jgi:pimeloyl-ACP methyl ester carboxylesterase